MRSILVASMLIAGCAAGSAGAAPAGPQELPAAAVTCPEQQPSISPEGKPVRLRAHVQYRAGLFPIPLRLVLPDGSWSGGQWKSGSVGCYVAAHGGIGNAPFYGWVSLGHGEVTGHQRGSIVVVTSYGRTPSVAAVAALISSRRRGVTYDGPTATRLAGLVGRQLDGRVDAVRHTFFAFTKPGAAAGAHADGVDMTQGALFRVLVLDAHGKTVVVYIGSGSLPASDFPAFLTSAMRTLAALRFGAA